MISYTILYHIRFISSRLDYCNATLYGVAASNLRRLQVVMNAAARLVTDTGRYEHITVCGTYTILYIIYDIVSYTVHLKSTRLL